MNPRSRARHRDSRHTGCRRDGRRPRPARSGQVPSSGAKRPIFARVSGVPRRPLEPKSPLVGLLQERNRVQRSRPLESLGEIDGGGDSGHVRPTLRSGVPDRPPADVHGGTIVARPFPDDGRLAAVSRAFPHREPASSLPPDGPGQHQRHEGQRAPGRAGAAPRGGRDHGRRQRVRDPLLRVVQRRRTHGDLRRVRQADSDRRRGRPRWDADGRPGDPARKSGSARVPSAAAEIPQDPSRLPDRGMDRGRRDGRGLPRPATLEEPARSPSR